MAFTNNRVDFFEKESYTEKLHAFALVKGMENCVPQGLELTGNTLSNGYFANGGALGQLGNEGETHAITTNYTGFLVIKTTFNGVNSKSEIIESNTLLSTPLSDKGAIKYFTIYELSNGTIINDFRNRKYIKSVEVISNGDDSFTIKINDKASNEFSTSVLQNAWTKSESDSRYQSAEKNSLLLANYFHKVQYNENVHETNVICIGDSVTAGVGSTSSNDYPSILERMLNEYSRSNNTFNVSNEGVGGYTAQDYWDNVAINTDYTGFDLAIIMLGTNDYNKVILRERYRKYMQLIIDKVLEGNCAIVLTTPHKWNNSNNNTKNSNGSISDYVAIVKSLGDKAQIPVLDLWTTMKNVNYVAYHDDIHFNDNGYAWLASQMYTQIGVLNPLNIPKIAGADFLTPQQNLTGFHDGETYASLTASHSYPTPVSDMNDPLNGIGYASGVGTHKMVFVIETLVDDLVIVPSIWFENEDAQLNILINRGAKILDYNNWYKYDVARSTPDVARVLTKSDFPSEPNATTTQDLSVGGFIYYNVLPSKGRYTIELEMNSTRFRGIEFMNKDIFDSVIATSGFSATQGNSFNA